jgi:glucuronate isomerase
MITRELTNSEQLLTLLDSDIEFMATTDRGESALMYGRNLKEMVQKRIKLMSAHRDDEPYIDPEYIERNAGQPA